MKARRGKKGRDQKKKQEEEEKDDRIVLTKEMLGESLCEFSSLSDPRLLGYTTLNLSSKQLEHLNTNLHEHKTILQLNLSNNQLTDFAQVSALHSLQKLDISNNKIKHLNYLNDEETYQNLIHLDARNNKIPEFPALKCSKLTYLNLHGNMIQKYDKFEGHPNLSVLVCSLNKFKNLACFKEMPKLTQLYLQDNLIPNFNHYENLPALQCVNLRANRIEKFEEELPELPSILKINLRENKVSNREELRKLFQFASLREINFIDTPLTGEENKYLIHEILIMNTKLEKVNKVEVTETMLQESMHLAEFKWRKAEQIRIAKEKEEKAKQEQEEEA
jgi:Leucine-rich repeat (LRR) protein